MDAVIVYVVDYNNCVYKDVLGSNRVRDREGIGMVGAGLVRNEVRRGTSPEGVRLLDRERQSRQRNCLEAVLVVVCFFEAFFPPSTLPHLFSHYPQRYPQHFPQYSPALFYPHFSLLYTGWGRHSVVPSSICRPTYLLIQTARPRQEAPPLKSLSRAESHYSLLLWSSAVLASCSMADTPLCLRCTEFCAKWTYNPCSLLRSL